jgi:aspartate/methionine/tyrosine aminotransferase
MPESIRVNAVQSPIIPVVGTLIAENPGTISLGQGIVNYGPPPEAIEYVARFATDPNNHRYKMVYGIPELIDPITEKLAADNNVTVNETTRVVVTAGANMGFINALLAIADPGDEIIIQSPYYFNHEMAITLANCKPVVVPTDENYQLQPNAIRQAITDRTRAIVTISPNNPTGAVYPENALREINALCAQKGIYHIADEAYEYFTYNGVPHFSPAAIPNSEEHTISLYSLSKSYGFASWRIGYMLIPEHLMPAVAKIQDTILICPPVVSQWAAAGALSVGAEYCHERVKKIAEVRKVVLAELKKLNDIITLPKADGAFYCLMKVHTELDAMTVVQRLVREHKVAVIPGDTFGITDACYLRVAFGVLEMETAQEGIKRLINGLHDIVGKNPA